MSSATREQIKPVPIRLPDELKKWLQHEAVDNGCSLNAEVVARLHKSRAEQLQKAEATKNK
jgi:hypothetical protein